MPSDDFWHELHDMVTGPRLWAEAPPQQFDLFSGTGFSTPEPEPESLQWVTVDPSRLSDADLLAAIPRASQREAPGLAQEAARRRLMNAVPALEALCRRFAGFGLDREVTEQVAALRGLASLGGAAAAEAVTRLIVSAAVRGPGVRVALEAASGLRCRLDPTMTAAFLRDDDPAVREVACRSARGGGEEIVALIDLMSDLHSAVARAAALALGRLGRQEARVALTKLLRTEPSAEVIVAITGIANDDDLVLLGQTAAMHPDLANLVLDALADTDSPRAAAVAAGVRRRLGIQD